ncbi:MAG: arsenate reductase [Planctomycetota bacterium]|jgi:arsenate reductase
MPTPLPSKDEDVLLLHNPRCSKCRTTQAMLEERGIGFEERNYLEQPLSREELNDLRLRLNRPAKEWTRSRESAYEESGLSDASDEDALLDAIAKHPILLERPILVRGSHAIVGRPPLDAFALFDS